MNVAERPEAVCPTDPPTGSVHRIVRNSTLNLLGQGVLAVFYLVVVFILARALGKEGLGEYYTYFALILAVQWVAEGGFSTVLTCRVAQRPEQWRTIIAEAAGLFAVVTLVSAGVFFIIGGGYAWAAGNAKIWWGSLAAGIACAGVQVNRYCGGVFRSFERVGYENFARFLQGGLFVLLVLALVCWGKVTVARVLGMFAASHFVASAYLLEAVRRHYGLGWRLSWPIAKDWVSEAVPLGFADVARHLTWQLDTLLLGVMQPAAVVGIYSVAYRPLGPLNWLPQAVLSAMFPAFARMADGDRAGFSKAFTHSVRMMWIISLPLAAIICLCAEPIIVILAGPEFLEAAMPMRVLIWISVLSFLSFPFRFLFTAVGKQALFARLVAAIFLVEAVIETLLIPRFGYMGACTGSVVGEFCFTVVGLVLCARLGIGRLPVSAMIRATGAALVMGAVLWSARAASWTGLGAAVLLSSSLYLALCLFLGALRWSELLYFRDALTGLFGARRAHQAPAPRPGATSTALLGPVDPDRPPPHPEPLHQGLIEDARAWMNRLRAEHLVLPAVLTPADLEDALGTRVESLQLWRVNWRNRIYRVNLHGGATVVAKQMLVPTDAEVTQEYRQLSLLAELSVPGLRVPRPRAVLPARQTYVMDFLPGATIQAMFWKRGPAAQWRQVCGLAGQVLGRLHRRWTDRLCPVPVHDLAVDLGQMPGGFTPAQWDTIRHALDRVQYRQTPVGYLYLDFKAENILATQSAVALIDPPPRFRLGILLWDFATFRASLCAQLWKSLASPGARRLRWRMEDGLAAFEQAYFSAGGHSCIYPTIDPVLVRLLELQHVGQMLAFQVGKLHLAVQHDNPLRRSGRYLREIGATLAWLPLLRLRKQSLLRRLRRDLEDEPEGDQPPGWIMPEATAPADGHSQEAAQLAHAQRPVVCPLAERPD